MAIRTFTSAGVNNLWSNAANWDTLPVDDDAITIASGQTCIFDIDMTSTVTWPNGVQNITLTGSTLYISRTPGTYYLRMKNTKTIGGVGGVFNCGTVTDQMPFNVKFTLKTAAQGLCFTGSSILYVYGQNPTYTQVKLTAGAILGATVLSVDTNLTGDIWADGDTIAIDSFRIAAASKCEAKVIAVGGIAATTITLAAGLTSAKNTGDIISLLTRNLRFEGGNNSWTGAAGSSIQGAWFSATGGGWLMGINDPGEGVYTGSSYGYYTATNITISKGIWWGVATLFHAAVGCSLTGGYVGNCTNVFSTGVGNMMSGGLVVGCNTVFTQCAATSVTGGETWGNWTLFSSCSVIGSGFHFRQNPYQLVNTYFTFYGVKLDVFANTYYTNLPSILYSQWYDYNQVAGAYKAWTRGGVTTKQAVTVPTGYAFSMQTILESATNKGYYQEDIVVGAGASINVSFFLRKSVSMTYLPRVLLFNKNGTDPLSGGTAIHTFTMTNSTDTWETESYTYTNTTTEAITLTARCQGMNASGNLFSLVDVDFINVDLTSALTKLTAIQAKTDTITSPSLLIDGELII